MLLKLLVILSAPSAPIVGDPATVPCLYVAAPNTDEEHPELEAHDDCATIDDSGRPEISPEHLAAVGYEDGIASMLIEGHWYSVKPSGDTLRVLTFDNGPDPWSEGLVRSRRHGRVAYFDREYEEVVPPRYDWGWPFRDGRALVCSGCREGPADGEHRPIVGGRWGYIDRSGNEVVPVDLSRDEALERGPD